MSSKGVAVSVRKRIFTIGLGIGLILFIRQIWVSYAAIQLHDFHLIRPSFLLAALGASLAMYLLLMVAWMMIMRHLGIHLSLRHTLEGYCLSFLPRYIPGTVWGYLGRSQWLQQAHGVGYTVSVMGSILEVVASVLTSLLVAGMYLCTRSTGSVLVVLMLACTSLLVLTLFVVPTAAVQIAGRLYEDEPAFQPGQKRTRRSWAAAITFYLAFWSAYGASVLYASSAIMILPPGDWATCTFAASLAWLLGFLVIFVPTGLGIRELALSTLLVTYANFIPWQADVLAVLSRFLIILAELAWSVVGLGLYTLHWRNNLHIRDRLPPSEQK